MSEHPILFTSEMVRAILTCAQCGTITVEIKCPKCGSLERRKTQTRRVIVPQPVVFDRAGQPDYANLTDPKKNWQVGDTIWVRENVRTLVCQRNNKTWEYGAFEIEYIADRTIIRCPDEHEEWWRYNWHKRPATTIPSIHMPRWVARIFLEITNIRIERVQDISEADCLAEGIISHDKGGKEEYVGRIMYASRKGNHCEWELSAKDAFENLWDSINVKRGYGWDENPWLWVVEFRKQLPK